MGHDGPALDFKIPVGPAFKLTEAARPLIMETQRDPHPILADSGHQLKRNSVSPVESCKLPWRERSALFITYQAVRGPFTVSRGRVSHGTLYGMVSMACSPAQQMLIHRHSAVSPSNTARLLGVPCTRRSYFQYPAQAWQVWCNARSFGPWCSADCYGMHHVRPYLQCSFWHVITDGRCCADWHGAMMKGRFRKAHGQRQV
jgi:hypothetical protein